MSYMSSQEILDRLVELSGKEDKTELIQFVTDKLPCIKNSDMCQPIFEFIYKNVPDPWHYMDDRHNAFNMKFMNDLRPHIEGKSVVDIGSGVGVKWNYAGFPLQSVTLVDISPECIEKAKELTKPNSFFVNYVVGGFQDYDIPEDLDVLYTMNALYYVPTGARTTFYRNVAVKKPRMIITGSNNVDPNDDWRDYMIKWPELLSTRYKCQDVLGDKKYELAGVVHTVDGDLDYYLNVYVLK